VSGITATGQKRLVLISGRAHPELAVQIAEHLGSELVPTDARTFANGEIYARFDESVRGSDAFVIQSHTSPINEWLMEQLIMVDALKRASAKRITVVAPFYPYARQDKKGRGREPISARLVADLFKAAGADRIMSIDLHAAQIQGFFDGPVDHLWALPVLADYVTAKYDTKQMMLFSSRANPLLAQEVAVQLGTELVPTSAYDFANGEIYVRFEESVRGSDAFVIQSHTNPINEAIMEHLLMVDALKRASAKRITVVMPFYGYARQDKKHRGREPISARLMADMFKTAGADRLICVDLHTDQIQGFFDGPVDHLMAIPILSEYVAAKYGDQDLAVVSPDAGRIKVAEQWSKRLGGVPLAFIHKTRDINRPNEMVANRVVGLVRDRVCVLVDDMIDTGGTITKAADALMADGAKAVIIAATHAILSDPAVDRLRDCAAEEVIVTNTLPIAAEKKEADGITVLSIAPLISAAIKEVFEDGSVTSLFGGRA